MSWVKQTAVPARGQRSLHGLTALEFDLKDADVQVSGDLVTDAEAVTHQIQERQNLSEKSTRSLKWNGGNYVQEYSREWILPEKSTTPDIHRWSCWSIDPETTVRDQERPHHKGASHSWSYEPPAQHTSGFKHGVHVKNTHTTGQTLTTSLFVILAETKPKARI